MKTSSSILLFDGDCSFCNFWVKFIIKRDPKKQIKFYSLQSKEGGALREKYEIPTNINSIVFFNKNKVYLKSTAALQVSKKLKFPWKLFYGFIIIPVFFRNWIYDFVAKHRHKLFKDVCELP